MNMDRMDQNEFEDLASRYGPDPAAWPAARREVAEALVSASAEARDFAAAMMVLEDDLRAARNAGAPVGAGLSERILADAAAISAARAVPPPLAARKAPSFGERLAAFLAPVWRPAAACAVSAAVGLMIGYVAPAGVAEASGALAALDAAEEFAGLAAGEDENVYEIALLGEAEDWGGLE